MWAAFRTKNVSRSAGALTPMDCMVRTISLLRAEDVPATSLDMRNIANIHATTEIHFMISRRFAMLQLLFLDFFEDLLVGCEWLQSGE